MAVPGRLASRASAAPWAAGGGPRASFAPRGSPITGDSVDSFTEFLSHGGGRLVCLSGAGCSTESGVPDYRSPEGSYAKGHRPMRHMEFVREPNQRKRYWARSLGGWRFFDAARPNVAHRALAALERHGRVAGVVTQNVDGLHQKAGSQNVVDLHGRNDEVACLGCGLRRPRRDYQRELEAANAEWVREHLPSGTSVDVRADGDAHLSTSDFAGFVVPPCSSCGGVWKPTVVFFGGSLEPHVKSAAQEMVQASSSVLVLGSSLQVFSAFSLIKAAAEAGKPVVLVNIGETRADPLVPPARRLPWQCGAALSLACERLGVPLPGPDD